ncbi:MAG: cyclic pyranopterin monophosphate synthase MoaC [Candidatus Lambdaproteobacteria bacterium]|nr:cyclic pyranopterin monophosphate synthase MoaC [Candidatus Lambdaproteobacteria bacterium]
MPRVSNPLTHFDATSGRARMVDVSGKVATRREAVARGRVKLSPALVAVLKAGTLEKGDAFTVAKTAGILAAKQTGTLIPMCHPLPLNVVQIALELDEARAEVRIEATAATEARTGVEMEAMVAVSVAALTFYDMCKAVDKGMVIDEVYLVRKTGGKSGPYENTQPR